MSQQPDEERDTQGKVPIKGVSVLLELGAWWHVKAFWFPHLEAL